MWKVSFRFVVRHNKKEMEERTNKCVAFTSIKFITLWYKFRFILANVLLFHLLTLSVHPYYAMFFTSSFGHRISLVLVFFPSFFLFENRVRCSFSPRLLLFVCLYACFFLFYRLLFAAPFYTSSHVALSFVCTIIFVCVQKSLRLLLLLCFLPRFVFIYIHENVDNISASTLASVHAEQFFFSVFLSAFSVFIRQCAIICVIA